MVKAELPISDRVRRVRSPHKQDSSRRRYVILAIFIAGLYILFTALRPIINSDSVVSPLEIKPQPPIAYAERHHGPEHQEPEHQEPEHQEPGHHGPGLYGQKHQAPHKEHPPGSRPCSGHANRPHGGFDSTLHHNNSLAELLKKSQALVSKSHLKESIKHYFTAGPHLAGQNQELVNYTRDYFEANGFETSINTYDVWMNYPISHRVALLDFDGSVKQELSLEEPELKEDPTTGRKESVPTFHGYSASGNATGELIYANLGRRQDYDRLIEDGVSLQDKVVLVRYGGIFRGLKVKFAEELGAAAVLIYSDPQEDGEITEKNGYAAYPDGPARHPNSVQRGSVQDLSHAPGDPTTPGFPSLPGDYEHRTDPQGIPSIPSIPISYADALPLLKALNGHGPQFKDWQGSLDGIEYNVGPSELKVVVDNQQDYDFRPNYDVIARIPGESSEEVILGNHRDAWIIGGADPNSGTAVLLEVARVFGELLKDGWKPKRTIVLASWDGEEYGLLGSTEWGEDHAEQIKKKALTYINCDVGVSGPNFGVSANPLLHRFIEKVADIVHVNETTTLSKHWGGERCSRIAPLGSGSDYTVFQDHLGIPSIDVGFSGNGNSPVYHYHSNYDSLHWMQKFGDPELIYHAAVTKFVIVSALVLIESDISPFGVVDYARSIKRDVKNLLESYEGPAEEDVGSLFLKLHHFIGKAKEFHGYIRRISREFKKAQRSHGFWNYLKLLKLKAQISSINSKLQKLDSNFLYENGLDERPWFKHVIYSPGRYTGYAGQVIPGIAESLEDHDEARLMKWINIIRDAVESATESLN